MKKRTLRFESLEDRQLLAVYAGGGIANAALVAPAEPTGAPSGLQIGDVYVKSTMDADGDGFIGPAELSYMSYAWFKTSGSANWNAASDLDGDGFIGPGDYAHLSANWFKSADALPDETKSYEIYPSNVSNWDLFGNKVSLISARGGTLSIDARQGELEALCSYDAFPGNLRVSADFTSTSASAGMRAGIEIAVQDSGARYYFEVQPDRLYLYYVSEKGVMTPLSGAGYTFNYNATYNIWIQAANGQIACGVGEDTLAVAADTRLSGGQVGFYAAEGVNQFKNITVESNPGDPGAAGRQVGDVFVTSELVVDGVSLDAPIYSYEIYPSNVDNWFLFGNKVSLITAKNGTLTIDARSGAQEAVSDYDAFPDDLRVTASFKSTDPTTTLRGGIELAVQDSGACYCAEFQQNSVCLYYVSESGTRTALATGTVSLSYSKNYTVWAQMADGRLACGLGNDVLLYVSDTRLSGGGVGFYGGAGVNVFQNIVVDTDPDILDIGISPEEENAQLRAEVVAYMRSMATVKWTPSEDITYYNSDYGVMFKAGSTYYGVPYSQKVRSGSYEKFTSYLDANGTYTGPVTSTTYIGSDCSSAVSMAWRVFDPSLSLLGTYYMFPGRGKIVAVGNYSLTSGSFTGQVTSDNGQDVMYAAYAQLKPGDAVLYYKNTGGHVRLISSVDVANQCVYVIEQCGASGYGTPIAGNSTWRVDRKITFASLFSNSYIPISHSGLQIS